MNELKQVAIIAGLLLALGILAGYFAWSLETHYTSDFTFYRSEINVNSSTITERLYYSPDEGYRTLYRNFITPVLLKGSPGSNAIVINDVKCQQGDAYYYTDMFYGGRDLCTFEGSLNCDDTQKIYFSFVEPNEYGCTKKGITKSDVFFYRGNDYWIQATYDFVPENLFEANGTYYLKFVAYSPGRHPLMRRGENLFVSGDVLMKNEFSANENVVIYIPVNKNEYLGANILPLDFSEGESISFISYMLSVRSLFFFAPFALFLLVWLAFGKENVNPQLPEILTEYPKKRKGWEVALFFRTPFMATGKEFFSSMLLELQSRKILQLKSKQAKNFLGGNADKLFIKILKKDELKDDIEESFMQMLKELEITVSKDANGFFEVNEALNKKSEEQNLFSKKTGTKKITDLTKDLNEKIKKRSKNYFDTTGKTVFEALLIIPALIIILALQIIGFILFGIVIYLFSRTTIMTRYKGTLYDEYERWQSFKRFMEDFTQLKRHPPEGSVMWGEYLTYATALGVADKVLDKLKRTHMISETQYENYHGIYIAGNSFSTSYASSTGGHGSGGGGGGGMGGGGGGGGGGGR